MTDSNMRTILGLTVIKLGGEGRQGFAVKSDVGCLDSLDLWTDTGPRDALGFFLNKEYCRHKMFISCSPGFF